MHLAEMRRRNPEKAVEYLRRALELAQPVTLQQQAVTLLAHFDKVMTDLRPLSIILGSREKEDE